MVIDHVVTCSEAEAEFKPRPWLRHTSNTPQGVANPRSLSLKQLMLLCDDPERDLPGGVNVRAVLTLDQEEGFYLSAQDGDKVYLITDDHGRRTKFRTVEVALSVLQNVSGLSPDIGLFQADRRRAPPPGRGPSTQF